MTEEERASLKAEFAERDRDRVEQTVRLVARHFPSFGGDRKPSGFNPLDYLEEGRPASFALNVDIEEVVCFIFKYAPPDPRLEEVHPQVMSLIERFDHVMPEVEALANDAREGHWWHTQFNELAFAVSNLIPRDLIEKHPFVQRAINSLHFLPFY